MSAKKFLQVPAIPLDFILKYDAPSGSEKAQKNVNRLPEIKKSKCPNGYRQHAVSQKIKDAIIYVSPSIDSQSKCNVCGSNKRLNIDHEHGKKMARGKLCTRCNLGAGYIEKLHKDHNLFVMLKYLGIISFFPKEVVCR
jgi:hypothetical protein